MIASPPSLRCVPRNEGLIARYEEVRQLMFDFPDIVRGLAAYDKTWDFFYANPRGPIAYEPRDMAITAGENVAFVSCTVHCDGTSAGPLDFRLTTGLRKIGGRWTIVHEHHSVPTVEEWFLGPDTK